MRCSPSRLSKTQTDGEAAVPLEGKKHRQNKEGTEDGKYQNNFANEMLCLLLLKQVPAEPAAFLSLALAWGQDEQREGLLPSCRIRLLR